MEFSANYKVKYMVDSKVKYMVASKAEYMVYFGADYLAYSIERKLVDILIINKYDNERKSRILLGIKPYNKTTEKRIIKRLIKR